MYHKGIRKTTKNKVVLRFRFRSQVVKSLVTKQNFLSGFMFCVMFWCSSFYSLKKIFTVVGFCRSPSRTRFFDRWRSCRLRNEGATLGNFMSTSVDLQPCDRSEWFLGKITVFGNLGARGREQLHRIVRLTNRETLFSPVETMVKGPLPARK